MLDYLDIVLYIFGPMILAGLVGLSGMYYAVKKFVADLAEALKDDVITKEELKQLVSDSLNIVNVIKHIFKR